jgi:hypothetical protein
MSILGRKAYQLWSFPAISVDKKLQNSIVRGRFAILTNPSAFRVNTEITTNPNPETQKTPHKWDNVTP